MNWLQFTSSQNLQNPDFGWQRHGDNLSGLLIDYLSRGRTISGEQYSVVFDDVRMLSREGHKRCAVEHDNAQVNTCRPAVDEMKRTGFKVQTWLLATTFRKLDKKELHEYHYRSHDALFI